MLKNFEDETCNLSEEELQIAQSVMKGLKKYVGKPNAKSGTTICSAYTMHTKFKLQGVRLRKIINHLRNKGEPFCSSSKGYFIQQTNKNFKTQSLQLLKGLIHNCKY